MGTLTNVFNIDFSHFIVGNRCLVPRQQPDSGRSQSDFFHDSVMSFGYDPLAYLVGLIQQNHDAAQQVLQCVLGGQSDCQPTDTEPGNKGADLKADIVQPKEYGNDDQCNPDSCSRRS